MVNIIGSNENDTLLGSNGADTINGEAGADTITGGGGKDTFVYKLGDNFVDQFGENTDTITDFGGVGKGKNPTAAVIAEVDTIKFQGAGLTARNLLLTQNNNNLEITFEGVADAKVILQNFALENLDNLRKSTGASVDLGNIEFDGQTSITDSFDVFNGNSTQSTIFNRNTVTFLNDLDNNVTGFDNSNDVINGQGGDDIIDGLSGNDILRGGAGNNTLNGGAGNDSLSASGSIGDNLLNGGDGNDYLDISGKYTDNYYYYPEDFRSKGNNTLNGGAGNDYLSASGSTHDNLLNGSDGNDSLNISGNYIEYYPGYSEDSRSKGNNTLNGGAVKELQHGS